MRHVVIAILIAASVAFGIANRSDLSMAWTALGDSEPVWIAAVVATSIAYLGTIGMLHATGLRSVEAQMSYPRARVLSWAALFINTIAKSGNLAGIAVFIDGSGEAQRVRVSVGYVLVTALGHIAFAVVLAASLVAIWSEGSLSRLDVFGGLFFAAYTAVIVGVTLLALLNRRVLRLLLSAPEYVKSKLRRHPQPESDHRHADELFDVAQEVKRAPQRMIVPTFWAIAVDLTGVLMLWFSLEAVGYSPGLLFPLLAYTTSILFMTIGFLPGGVGAVEASLGAVLIAADVAPAQAIAAIAIYRVFEMWLPAVVGLVALRYTRRAIG